LQQQQQQLQQVLQLSARRCQGLAARAPFLLDFTPQTLQATVDALAEVLHIEPWAVSFIIELRPSIVLTPWEPVQTLQLLAGVLGISSRRTGEPTEYQLLRGCTPAACGLGVMPSITHSISSLWMPTCVVGMLPAQKAQLHRACSRAASAATFGVMSHHCGSTLDILSYCSALASVRHPLQPQESCV
jgi:hypothetical protein